MKNIYLIRHCKAGGQQPAADLTADGKRQADELAYFLEDKNIAYVVTSPYLRAISSIKPLCDRRKIQYHIDDRLKERVLSTQHDEDWQDKLKNTYVDLDLTYEGGESSNEAMRRGVEVIEEMIARPEADIAIVTHGTLMSLLLKYHDSKFGYDEWKNLSNPDIYVLNVSKEGTAMSRIWK